MRGFIHHGAQLLQLGMSHGTDDTILTPESYSFLEEEILIDREPPLSIKHVHHRQYPSTVLGTGATPLTIESKERRSISSSGQPWIILNDFRDFNEIS